MSGHAKDTGGGIRKTVIVLLLVGGVFLLHRFAARTVGFDPSAMLALGFVVLASYTFGQLVEKVGLPHITGYLIAGLALGPSAAAMLSGLEPGPPFDAGVLSENIIGQLAPLNTLAVALIALTAGGELKIASLKKGFGAILGVLGGQMVLIMGFSIAFVIGISGVLPMVTLPGLGPLDLSGAAALGAVVGSISLATSPAATIAVINDVQARGPMTSTVLATVVLKDVIVVVLFAVVSTLAAQAIGMGGTDQRLGLYLLKHIGGALVLGVVMGFVMTLYLRYVKQEVLLFVVGMVFTASFVASELDVESVVLFITAGFVTANFSSEGDQMLETVEKLSLPVYVVFFTLAGANLHLAELPHVAGFAFALIAIRIAGIWLGTRVGGKLGGASPQLRSYGWLGFISQAGVAISLASIIGRRMGEAGEALSTMIIAGIAINEVIGPVALKIGLGAGGETAKARGAEKVSKEEPAAVVAEDSGELRPWPAPERGADAWGPPLETTSGALEELTRDLQLDLSHIARDVAEEPLARFREDALGYIRELRREFLRHHRRITVQALAEATELSAAEALRLEQAELAEKWRAAVLARAARISQQPGWEPAPIVAAVDSIGEGLPERVLAPYEAQSFESKDGDGPITSLSRSWLRTRLGVRRLFGDDMAERSVEMRALARYHLWGQLPGRLEPVAALYAQAESHLVSRTRSIFDGLVVAYDELAADVEKAQRQPAPTPARAPLQGSTPLTPSGDGYGDGNGDGNGNGNGNGAESRTSAPSDVTGAPDDGTRQPAGSEPTTTEATATAAQADEAGTAPPTAALDTTPPFSLEERLKEVRQQVDEELVLAVQEIDRIASDLALRTSLAIGSCLRDLKADLPLAGTADLPMRRRAASKLYRRRGDAYEWLERGSAGARALSSAIYNRLALEMELHALEGRVKDALEEHATALGRDVRGRTHRQALRVEAAIGVAHDRLSTALDASSDAATLAKELRALTEPVVRVSSEAARVATMLRDQLSDEVSVTPVLDALTRAAQNLTDRYRIPAGPLARAEHRLPPQVGTVEVPFRDWVLARIETSIAPRLLSSTREVAQKVEPLAQTLSELERRVAFNVELAVNELTVVEDEAPSAESKRLVREMIGGALERNHELFAGYATASERWDEEVRGSVRRAVLDGLDELRGGLVDGEAGRMRTQMVRDVRGRRLSRVASELRRAMGRSLLIGGTALRDSIGEARLERARAILGLPRPTIDQALLPETFEPQEPSDSIPMVYRRLFSAQALEAGDILTGRDEALSRALRLLEGSASGGLRTVAVVGPDGVGKSAFVNAVRRAKRWAKVRELKLEAPATVAQVDALFDGGTEGHLVVLTGMQWLRSIRPGGFEPLRRFVARVIEDGGRNAFLVRADSLVWAQECELAPLRDAFPEVIGLDPLESDALRAAVLARHTVSGFGLVFSQGLEPESRLEELVSRATAPLSRPQESFFRSLHGASGGLLRDALRLWLASVTEVEEASDFVHLGPVPTPALFALRRLTDEEVLTLYQVARQGWMDHEVCGSLFRVGPSTAEARLLALAHVGILERDEGRYRVALHLRGSVRRLLEERGFE